MSVSRPDDDHAHRSELAKAITANEWVRHAVAMQFAYESWMQSGRRPEADPS